MQNDPLDQTSLQQELLRDLIKEKRSDRRWKNVRFFLGFLVVVILLLLCFTQTSLPIVSEGEGKGYVALIRLEGMIGPGEDFSAETVIPLLSDAFSDTEAKGVILAINSGGGTPVQASIIHDAILEMKKRYRKRIVVVGEDMLASGAYFVAVAADKIYVNPNSITGSIGVVMKGFGFPQLIKKVGVERRVYASGADKDRLDPFLPQAKDDVQKIQQVIGEIHDNFIQVVMEGRKGKLKAPPSVLFSGDFWSGNSALKLGLIDGVSNLTNVMRNEFKVSKYKDYSQTPSIVKSLTGQFGAALDMLLNKSQVKVLEEI